MSAMNRPFVGRPLLAAVRQAVASPIQKRILSPRLGKNGDAAWSQYAEQLRCGRLKIQMMQNRVAPNSVEGAIGERQPLAVGLHEIDVDLVGSGSLSGFAQVTPRQIEGGDSGASPGQHDRRHAVAATEIEHPKPLQVPQLIHGRPNPSFVV